MKILYIITKSNMGGAQRYVYDLATHFHAQNHAVAAAFGGEGALKANLEATGIKTYTVEHFARDIRITQEFAALRELISIIRNVRPDVVHINSSKAGVLATLAARICGIRTIIFTAHGWPFFEPRSLIWRTFVWAFSYITTLCAHAVIVVSKYDYIHACMPGLTHKLHLIHNAIPHTTFLDREEARRALVPHTIREKHEDALWLVSTGEHTKNKNLAMLVDAFAVAQKQSAVPLFLVLMSDGEDREKLERKIHDLNIENHVYLTGFVQNARTYLRAFDIFLMPSLKEGFPYGLLEAGAARLAVIASNVGGIPELIEHRKTGLLIDPRDTQALADLLLCYAQDAHQRVTNAANLSHVIETSYAQIEMFTDTETLYTR